MNTVTIVATGKVGSGKSALLGEIEITLRALNVSYEWADPAAAQCEKNVTGADWTGELERTKPHVVLVERIQRTADSDQTTAAAMLERARAAEAEVARLRALLGRRPAFHTGLVEAYSKWSADVYESDAAATHTKAGENAS
jgi:hypothetical protein